MFGLSDEQSTFARSSKCPKCGRTLWQGVVLKKADGTPIGPLTAYPFMDRSAIAQCPKCTQSWPVFADQPPVPIADHIEIVETGRSWEDYYSEPMVLDNLGGETPLKRTITVNEEWSASFVIETERTTKSGADVKLSAGDVASLGVTAERAVRTKYALTEGTKKVYTDQLTLEAPPNRVRHVRFDYKREWMHGEVRISDPSPALVSVPFRVAVGIKMDVAVRDERGAI